MIVNSEKEQLCAIGKRIWQQGLSPGTGGNISIKIAQDRICISPTLTSMGFMEPKDLCVVDLNGKVITCRAKPSSEHKLHLYVYNKSPEINAVIHAHPPFASAFAVVGEELNTFIQPETVVFLRKIPVVEYGTPSTAELSERLDKYLKKGYNTFLLQNHGVLCIGENLDRTYNNLETLENLAKVTVISRQLGGEKEISRENLKKLIKLFNVDLEI
jgi:L-fuculose-phosphate aldolase